MESDSTKRVVINKEARKIVVQRKQPAAAAISGTDDEKLSEVKEITFELETAPVEKKAKLTVENLSESTTTPTTSVQQKLSALERLKSLNFSAPKSAVNPFSFKTPTKSATFEIHKSEEKLKIPLDNRPLIPPAPVQFQQKKLPSILSSDDVKPKPLFDFQKSTTNAAKFFEPNFPVRPSFPRPPNDVRHQNRLDFHQKPTDFLQKPTDFLPRQSQSPPIFNPNLNFPQRFPPPHLSSDPNLNPFFARSVHSPTPVFNPNDIWLNPIYVQKDYLEKEKLENLQISDMDLNSLSVVGLKNTIEYLLEIDSDLSSESARLSAQIKTIQRGLETFPRKEVINYEHSSKPKTKKIHPKSSEKEKTGSKPIISAVSDENFTKALFKAINDQADARKKGIFDRKPVKKPVFPPWRKKETGFCVVLHMFCSAKRTTKVNVDHVICRYQDTGWTISRYLAFWAVPYPDVRRPCLWYFSEREMNLPPSSGDAKHENVGDFTSNMAMAKIFFAGMVSSLSDKLRTDSRTF